MCVDDKFSKAFETYLDEDVVYNNTIKDSKKHFNKEGEDFKNSTECWICANVYFDNGVKVERR